VQIVVPGHSRGGLDCVLPTRVDAITAGVNLRREHSECLASLHVTGQYSLALTRCSKRSKGEGIWLIPEIYCC